MNLKKLKFKRMSKELYQYQIAQKMGISNKTYNFKENGRIVFTVEEVLKVIECLDMTLEEADDIFFSNKLPKSK